MPLTVKSFPTSRPTQKVEVTKGKGSVSLLSDKSNKEIFSVNLSTPATVRLNTIYFPGWHWYKNGKEVPISYNNPHGVMEAELAPGNYTIQALFQNTVVRSLGNSISLLSILLIVAASGYRLIHLYLFTRLVNRRNP
jgi:hypothetical protein